MMKVKSEKYGVYALSVIFFMLRHLNDLWARIRCVLLGTADSHNHVKNNGFPSLKKNVLYENKIKKTKKWENLMHVEGYKSLGYVYFVGYCQNLDLFSLIQSAQTDIRRHCQPDDMEQFDIKSIRKFLNSHKYTLINLDKYVKWTCCGML